MAILLEDANGVLWSVWANLFGELRSTPGATGTSVGVFLNDASGASWQITIATEGSPIYAVPSGTRDYPTSIAVDSWWSLSVVDGQLVTWASSKLRLWQETVISQYANSPTLLAIIENFNAAIDVSTDLDNFYSWIWDIDTAQGLGLDIWGRIVGVNRTIQTSPPTVLDDADFRSLILLKALSNISVATSPSINRLLQNWIGSEGRAYVNDLGGMEIKYQFEFPLTPVQEVILTQSGIFLRPAGVGGWVVATAFPVFGFKEMGDTWAAPFDQEPFLEARQPYAVG
jgi:Protein of unknown function (DUF2612)